MQIQYRPITIWPGPMTAKRKRSAFKADYNNTLGLLDHELRQLDARAIVLQVALLEDDIRLDGLPRADRRPRHPGVILSFESKHGPLSYPCDTYLTLEENLRAIALSLEYLRAVDRYGVTRRGEQYRGWQALPAPEPATIEEALQLLFRLSGQPVSRDNWREAFRLASLKTHPDRGGDVAAFHKVQKAKELLENKK